MVANLISEKNWFSRARNVHTLKIFIHSFILKHEIFQLKFDWREYIN